MNKALWPPRRLFHVQDNGAQNRVFAVATSRLGPPGSRICTSARRRNAPHRFRLALVSVAGDQATAPVYVSGVDWGLPGFGDTQITKNLQQQLLAAGRAPH